MAGGAKDEAAAGASHTVKMLADSIERIIRTRLALQGEEYVRPRVEIAMAISYLGMAQKLLRHSLAKELA